MYSMKKRSTFRLHPNQQRRIAIYIRFIVWPKGVCTSIFNVPFHMFASYSINQSPPLSPPPSLFFFFLLSDISLSIAPILVDKFASTVIMSLFSQRWTPSYSVQFISGINTAWRRQTQLQKQKSKGTKLQQFNNVLLNNLVHVNAYN